MHRDAVGDFPAIRFIVDSRRLRVHAHLLLLEQEGILLALSLLILESLLLFKLCDRGKSFFAFSSLSNSKNRFCSVSNERASINAYK